MSMAALHYPLAFVLVFMRALPGCAEYRQCRLEGCPPDTKITADVQARLNQITDVGSTDSIKVQTLDHVVYPNGLVDAGSEKSTAESVAKQVPGVTRVVNNIAVSHSRKPRRSSR
jgi:osmotically-inducible protein OsmY